MTMSEVIRHEGVVLSTDGKMAHIVILQASACSACKAAGLCMSADSKEKEMDAWMLEPMQPGDKVEVMVQERLAWKAVFFAYILPFLIMMVLMISLLWLTDWSESVVGASALVSIALYYLCLTLFRSRFKKHFSFTARKI